MVITLSVLRNCAVEHMRDKSIIENQSVRHYSPVCVFLYAPLLACLSVCPVFVVVAGMWGCGLCNPPDYVVSMTRDISDGIYRALPACILCMSLCIVWLQLEHFLCVSRLNTPEIFFPAEADLHLCVHCKSRNSTQLTVIK